jgi:hypothetical protein
LRATQIFLSGLREFSQEQWLDVRFPSCVDDGLMGKDGIRVNGRRQRKQYSDQANDDPSKARKHAIHHSS